ncbi:MAG TPA: hypothetical protein VGM77_12245 [Gemmatimonadales bacterium]|jgi:hypothetical protein
MYMVPGERELMATNGDILVLTTHRVRMATERLGQGHLMSITLDSVASCGLATRTYPMLLLLAAIIGTVPLLQQGRDRMPALWIVAGICVVGYFITRASHLTIASAGGSIHAPISGMNHGDLINFVDAVEEAKLAYATRAPSGAPTTTAV